jgi:UDP-glucose 4-epimerase
VKCLVSGATGFVGRELCRHLAASGYSTVALSRSGAPLADGTATLAVDFMQQSLDSSLLQGVDVVFNLAGVAHQSADRGVYQRLNHDAALELAHEALNAGVGCFVHVSSVKAMGPSEGQVVRTEGQCRPPLDDYGRSKLLAEQSLRAAFRGSKTSLVILRPALIYGPGVKGNLQLLARAVRAGIPRLPEAGARSMIALKDLVILLHCIARQPPEGVNTWNVTDGQRYSVRCIHDLMRQALGESIGRTWLPLWAWYTAAFLRDKGIRGSGETTFEKLFGTELYCGAAVQAALSWQPQLTLADVMGEMMDETMVDEDGRC